MLVDVSVIELGDLWCAEHERCARVATRRVDGDGPTGRVVHDEVRARLAVQRQRRDVDAKVFEVVGLWPEGQRADARMCPVGADDDVETTGGSRDEIGGDPVRVLLDRRHRVAELKLHVVRHRVAQDRRELAAGQLDVAGFGPGVAHVDAADHVSARVDEDHVAHACVGGADLRHNAHPLGDLDGRSADVDRAAAGSHVCGLLHDRHVETGLG